MVTWYEVLEEWGYPKPEEVAPKLEELGLCPDYYRTRKTELFNVLAQYFQEQTGLTATPRTLEIQCPDWLKWLCDFLGWLWNQIAPWALDVGLIIVGGLATTFLSGWFRVIGIVPAAIGVLRILKRTGIIDIPWLPA